MTTLIIAFAGLWLSLPAAAQFEINPDHFDEQDKIVVQPRPTQAKKSVRVHLHHKQIQRDRVQAFEGAKNPTTATLTSSSAAAVQRRRRIGKSRVARGLADRKTSKQSRLAASHLPYEGVPQ